MSKRKQPKPTDDGDDSDISLVDVDFEFFDPNPSVDYHALNRLIVQQFQTDADAVHPTELADLILSQAGVGTTIKCDGPESDPYAFLTVVDVNLHKDHPSMKGLSAYTLSKTTTVPDFHSAVETLLDPSSSKTRLGFVFCERLINMPVQVIPPMYRMLAEELKSTTANSGSSAYTHLLFISRIYRLTPEEEADMLAAAPPTKRRKQKAAPGPTGNGTFSFHPEDEHLQGVATYVVDYSFTNAQPRDKESFGLDTGGRMMLVPFGKLDDFVGAISEAYAVPP